MNQGARKPLLFTLLAAAAFLSCHNTTETPTTGNDSPNGDGVLTRSNNLERTGANLKETTLRADSLTNFGKLYCQSVDSEIYGQILYVPNLDLGTKGKHNMVYVVTMQSSIYAFDADNGMAPAVWLKQYANPGAGVTAIPVGDVGQICIMYNGRYNDVSQFVGILSTPVIDAVAQTIYFVARVKETFDGTPRYVQRLHALSLTDGSERPGSPVDIEGSTGGTAADAIDGVVNFNPRTQNQRAGLLLHQGVVYITWASHCDQAPYHGWVIGYDATSMKRVVAFNTSPNGKFAGIWMSGQAPAVDGEGNIYLMTGNGTTDINGGPNHANSFLKLRRQGGSLSIVDWFTPFNYDVLELQDRDLGAGGAILVPGRNGMLGQNMVLGGGKEGKLYVVDSGKLGKFEGGNNDEQIMQRLDITPRRQHIHGAPVYWKSSAGEYVYVWPEEDFLKQYRLTDSGLQLVMNGTVRAPNTDPDAGSTMPGGILSVSANGDKPGSGIIWANMNVMMNAIHKVVPGVLRAFDANDVTKELWNSEQNPDRDSYGGYAKFNPVTVYGGKVYVPTFSQQYCVYGNL